MSAGPFHRPLVLFATYLAGIILGASVLAALLFPLLDFPFDKVFSRALILMAVLLAFPVAKRLQLNAADLGVVQFSWRTVGVGMLLGALLIMPPVLVAFGVGYRVVDGRVDPWSLGFAFGCLKALVSGLLVGFVEEGLFRGLVLSVTRRWLVFWPAAMVCSVLYALPHFISLPDEHVPITDPGFGSGLELLSIAVAPIARPLEYWDSFLSLWLLGMGFCWVRWVTGNIWLCVGLHAGFVAVIRIVKDLTVRDVVNEWAWIVGEYDHFVGHLVTAWLLLLGLGVLVWQLRGRPAGA